MTAKDLRLCPWAAYHRARKTQYQNQEFFGKSCLSSYQNHMALGRQFFQSRHQQQIAIAVLVLMCAIWGSTFALLKTLTLSLSALEITLLRYGGAGLILLLFVRGIRPAEWRWGLIYGLTLFTAFYLQTEGIARTSANRNAFITGLNVLAVPILAIALGQRPSWRLWGASALAAWGMYLLFFQQAAWNMGDSYTAAAMLCYAVYILLLDVSAQRHRHRPLRIAPVAALQGLIMGLLALLGMLAQNQTAFLPAHIQALTLEQGLSLAYLLLFASALAPAMQIWAQRHVSAVQSALIYGLEPVFAAIMAYYWIGETLTGWALLGAGLIVTALLWSQWPPKSSTE
jgi:drug/metabolite transporter (DMT)-like permease